MSEVSAVPSGVLLLKLKGAARMLSLSPRYVWDLTAQGKIPCIRISRKAVRYSTADLAAWVEKQRGGAR